MDIPASDYVITDREEVIKSGGEDTSQLGDETPIQLQRSKLLWFSRPAGTLDLSTGPGDGTRQLDDVIRGFCLTSKH